MEEGKKCSLKFGRNQQCCNFLQRTIGETLLLSFFLLTPFYVVPYLLLIFSLSFFLELPTTRAVELLASLFLRQIKKFDTLVCAAKEILLQKLLPQKKCFAFKIIDTEKRCHIVFAR